MYCKYCGAELSNGAIYCGSCGKSQVSDQQRQNNLQAAKSVQTGISEEICMLIAILLSVATVLTALMTWLKVDMVGQWDLLELCQSVVTDDVGVDDAVGLLVLVWIILIVSVIGGIVHVYAVGKAAMRSKNFLGNGMMAAAWTFVLSILGFVFILAEKHLAEQEWIDMGDWVHPGAGLICCCIFSIVQMFASHYLAGKMTVKKLSTDHTVFCADCGAEYVRITAATACPVCGSHAYQSEASHTDQSTPCAYCGTRFVKNGALSKCPHCGRVQPQRANNASSVLVCPKCKHENPKGSVVCINCHTPFIGVYKHEEESVFCAMCGKKIPVTASVCPYCHEAQ